MTEKGIKRLRNAVVLVGIVGSFLIWLFVPSIIRNDAFMHVGNGPYGSKIGCLLVLILPLFAFLQDKGELESHGEDEAHDHAVRKRAAVTQLIRAIVLSGIALAAMVIALLRA